jgi:uncharacterized OB-fold protein
MRMNIENGDSKPYWEGVRKGELLFQRCKECGHVQFPPRQICVKCWKQELTWTKSSGNGTVESVTIVHRAPTPEMRNKVPYVVATILLEEGPRMVTNVVGPDALDVAINDSVKAVYVEDPSGRLLPQFQRLTR